MAFERISGLFDKAKGMINDVRNPNGPPNLVGIPQGSQDAFQASLGTQPQDNTAYSAEEEPWDWEEDEHDMALRDFEGMSPELQEKQVRENKWKGRFQSAGDFAGKAGGLLAGAMSNMKVPQAYETQMIGRQPQRPQGLLGSQYSDNIQY